MRKAKVVAGICYDLKAVSGPVAVVTDVFGRNVKEFATLEEAERHVIFEHGVDVLFVTGTSKHLIDIVKETH